MTDRLPGAFTISLTLHAAIAGLMLLLTYAANQSREDTTKIFELVAGEGDNFGATVAPKLGEPGGIKVDVPPPVTPKPEAPQPQPAPEIVAQPEPPKPAPKPKAEPKIPDLKLDRKLDRAEERAKAAVTKQRAEEAKKMTKAEFDAKNKKPVTQVAANNPKVTKIDAEGIRKGVEGGSTDNKIGGAGGKALTATEGSAMERYFAMLAQRLRTALQEKAAGLSDTLVAEAEVRIGADGSLSSARITRSSGNQDYDHAVLAAIAATRMPARPDKKSETLTIPFRMKETDESG